MDMREHLRLQPLAFTLEPDMHQGETGTQALSLLTCPG
jgi:hypothetical protein